VIIFVQPFGLSSAGGGARILRALIGDSPVPFTVVCTLPERPPSVDVKSEIHLPLRPYFGRIERTRLAWAPQLTTPLYQTSFVRKLEAICRGRGATAIHAIPHGGLDFHHAFRIAGKLDLPYFLQVHDDLFYSAEGMVKMDRANEYLGEVWRDARARFVISRRLGDEYCHRYGQRDYVTVTDGVERLGSVKVAEENELRIYFMGLFHLSYEENLRALVAAMLRLRDARPALRLSITLRCGYVRPQVFEGAADLVTVLPFGSEADVENDLRAVDLLYLPLPFAKESTAFVQFSLSTKMVSYIGSGVPILYHGPSSAMVYDMLVEHDAAVSQTSRSVDELTDVLGKLCDDRQARNRVARNALKLARAEFMLVDQRQRFWSAIGPALPRERATGDQQAV
jgi:glycosyltransferase involved in cell wall biosynthesis